MFTPTTQQDIILAIKGMPKQTDLKEKYFEAVIIGDFTKEILKHARKGMSIADAYAAARTRFHGTDPVSTRYIDLLEAAGTR